MRPLTLFICGVASSLVLTSATAQEIKLIPKDDPVMATPIEIPGDPVGATPIEIPGDPVGATPIEIPGNERIRILRPCDPNDPDCKPRE